MYLFRILETITSVFFVMDEVNQCTNGTDLSCTEENIDNCDNDLTPTGSMNSIGRNSLNSVSTSASFRSAVSKQDGTLCGSIGSFRSLGGDSFTSVSTTRSFKSSKSHTDTDGGSNFSTANTSLRSLGTDSFRSCSTYASFKSAKSHTGNENGSDLTPTNSLNSFRSFLGGSVDSFQSFKSARSGTTYDGDDQGTLRGSMGSLESFSSFTTFASFKNARSDLSLSETLTGDNDFASLHRFCMNSPMERGINQSNLLNESDEEDEDDLLSSVLENKDPYPSNGENPSSQTYIRDIPDSTNINTTTADVKFPGTESECVSTQKIVDKSDISENQIRRSSSTSRLSNNMFY